MFLYNAHHRSELLQMDFFRLFFCAAVIVPFVTLPALASIVFMSTFDFMSKFGNCHFPNLIKRVNVCNYVQQITPPIPPHVAPTPVM